MPSMLAPLFISVLLSSGDHAGSHSAEADLFVAFPSMEDAAVEYAETAFSKLSRIPEIERLIYQGLGLTKPEGDVSLLQTLLAEAAAASPLPKDQTSALVAMWSALNSASFSVSGFSGSLEGRVAGLQAAEETLAELHELYANSEFAEPPSPTATPGATSSTLTELPRETGADAWGRPYIYQSTGEGSYRLLSLGADGAEGGSGDAADLSSSDRIEDVAAGILLDGIRTRAVFEFSESAAADAAEQLLESFGVAAGELGESRGGDCWWIRVPDYPSAQVLVERRGKALVIDAGFDGGALEVPASFLDGLDAYQGATKHFAGTGSTVWSGYATFSAEEVLSLLGSAGAGGEIKGAAHAATAVFGSGSRQVAWRTGLSKGRFVKETLWSAPAEGTKEWLRHRPVNPSTLEIIPADTMGFYAAALDASFAVEQLLETAATAAGATREQLVAVLEGDLGAGFDAKLIASLGNSAVICFDVPGLRTPKIRMYAELVDSGEFQRVFGGLWDAVEAMVRPEDVKFKRRKYRGSELFTLSKPGGGLGVPQPTFVVLGDHVLFTLSGSDAKREVKALAAGQGEDPSLHPSLQGIVSTGPYSVTYFDWGGLIGETYDLAQMAMGMFSMWESFGVDSAALPKTAQLTSPFEPTFGVSRAVEGGHYSRRESSVGPELVLVPVISGLAAWMTFASAEPAQGEVEFVAASPVRDEEIDPAFEQTRATLRALKTDLKIYQLHNDRLPDELSELLEASLDFPNGIIGSEEVPKDAWNRVPFYRRTASGYELYSLGRDGLDQGGAGDDIRAE